MANGAGLRAGTHTQPICRRVEPQRPAFVPPRFVLAYSYFIRGRFAAETKARVASKNARPALLAIEGYNLFVEATL